MDIKQENKIPEFSLSGGTLHRLGSRLGLVCEGSNSIRLGLVLGLLAWGILMLLVFLHGPLQKAFSLTFIGVHVRLLVAIPLFFTAETWVVPRMAEFVRNIVNSGLVPESSLPLLKSDIHRITRLKDSWMVDIIFVLLAFVLPLFVNMPGRTSSLDSIIKITQDGSIWVKIWYVGFCLPLFRFLILRWLWQLGMWWFFLWRLAKLELHLIPTHPDAAAGLGYLEVVQEHFTPLVVAISAILSASFAEDISSETMVFTTLYSVIPIVLLINAILFICPLFLFTHKLWITRITGLNEYMVMAHHYVEAFDRKWLRDEKVTGEEQLGTGDIQSLADLNNSVTIVQNMRIIPAGRRLLVSLASSAIIPLLPLLLLKYPLLELAGKLLNILAGQ